MSLIADHSTAGAIIGGTLKRDGFVGAIRYAAQGRADVNITPAEYRDLKANGLEVGIVVEHEATWLLRGPLAVSQLIAGARSVWREAGIPDGITWLACDFDATKGGPTRPGSPGDHNMHQIAASLHGAATLIGHENVGFYGSAYAIDWLTAHEPWVQWYWDTAAWSGGRPPHPRAQLYQRAQQQNVAGVQVDIDDRLSPQWGQRQAPEAHKPIVVITPRHHHVPRPKLPKAPHPKVIGTTAGAGLSAAIYAILHTAGVHITPLETTAIATVCAAVSGYITPAKGGRA